MLVHRERRKKRALSITNLAVKDCVVPYILTMPNASHMQHDMVDPAVCWERLKNLYATNNNARHMLLRRDLTILRREEGFSIFTFLQETKILCLNLLGLEIHD